VSERVIVTRKDPTSRIKKLIKENKQWLIQVGEEDHKMNCEELEDVLAAPDTDNCLSLPVDFFCMANYYGTKAYSFNESMSSQLRDIETALLYKYYSFKIDAIGTLRPSQLSIEGELYIGSCLLLYGMATNNTEIIQLCSKVLHEVLIGKRPVSSYYFEERCFDKFVYKLYGKYIQDEDMTSFFEVEQAPFVDVLENWNDSDRLVSSLIALCDYHCANMGPDLTASEVYHRVYSSQPFTLMPVEVFAIQNIKKREGQDFPNFSHPLMDIEVSKDFIKRNINVSGSEIGICYESLITEHLLKALDLKL
jgi:hypothetical protein